MKIKSSLITSAIFLSGLSIGGLGRYFFSETTIESNSRIIKDIPVIQSPSTDIELLRRLAILESRMLNVEQSSDALFIPESEHGNLVNEDKPKHLEIKEGEIANDIKEVKVDNFLDEYLEEDESTPDPDWIALVKETSIPLLNNVPGNNVLDVTCSSEVCRVDMQQANQGVASTLLQTLYNKPPFDNGVMLVVGGEPGLDHEAGEADISQLRHARLYLGRTMSPQQFANN